MTRLEFHLDERGHLAGAAKRLTNECGELPERFAFAYAYCKQEKVLFMHGGFDSEYNHSSTRFLSISSSTSSSSSVSIRQLSSDHDRFGPSPRGYHAAIYVEGNSHEDNFVYTFGGQCCSGGPYEFYSDVHRLNLRTLRWEPVECAGGDRTPSPRSQCHAFARGGAIFVYGGYDGHSIMTDLHRLDLETKRWKKVETRGTGPTGLKGLSPLDFHIYFCRPSGTFCILHCSHKDMTMFGYFLGLVVGKRLLLLTEDYERSTAAAFDLNLNTMEWTRLAGTSGSLVRSTVVSPSVPPVIQFDPPARGSPTLTLVGKGHLVLVGGHPRDADSGDPEGRVWRLNPPRCLDWRRERLLWLACLKNRPEDGCLLARCPPHVIYKIIGFVNAGAFCFK